MFSVLRLMVERKKTRREETEERENFRFSDTGKYFFNWQVRAELLLMLN